MIFSAMGDDTLRALLEELGKQLMLAAKQSVDKMYVRILTYKWIA
jgi:hypothetical protein